MARLYLRYLTPPERDQVIARCRHLWSTGVLSQVQIAEITGLGVGAVRYLCGEKPRARRKQVRYPQARRPLPISEQHRENLLFAKWQSAYWQLVARPC